MTFPIRAIGRNCFHFARFSSQFLGGALRYWGTVYGLQGQIPAISGLYIPRPKVDAKIFPADALNAKSVTGVCGRPLPARYQAAPPSSVAKTPRSLGAALLLRPCGRA